MSEDTKCICCGKIERYARGLCRSCYSVARDLVIIKQVVSWETLERKKKCLPKQTNLVRQRKREWFLDKDKNKDKDK
jgi:hypothetical protein